MLGDMIGWSERTVRPPDADLQKFYNEQGTSGPAWPWGSSSATPNLAWNYEL